MLLVLLPITDWQVYQFSRVHCEKLKMFCICSHLKCVLNSHWIFFSRGYTVICHSSFMWMLVLCCIKIIFWMFCLFVSSLWQSGGVRVCPMGGGASGKGLGRGRKWELQGKEFIVVNSFYTFHEICYIIPLFWLSFFAICHWWNGLPSLTEGQPSLTGGPASPCPCAAPSPVEMVEKLEDPSWEIWLFRGKFWSLEWNLHPLCPWHYGRNCGKLTPFW